MRVGEPSRPPIKLAPKHFLIWESVPPLESCPLNKSVGHHNHAKMLNHERSYKV